MEHKLRNYTNYETLAHELTREAKLFVTVQDPQKSSSLYLRERITDINAHKEEKSERKRWSLENLIFAMSANQRRKDGDQEKNGSRSDSEHRIRWADMIASSYWQSIQS